MKAMAELPKAFSVRDENEFFPIRHLLTRLNPKLIVLKVALGRHIHGDSDVFWGLVCLEGGIPSRSEVEAALREAGFDFGRNALDQGLSIFLDPQDRPTRPEDRSPRWVDRVLPPWLRAA